MSEWTRWMTVLAVIFALGAIGWVFTFWTKALDYNASHNEPADKAEHAVRLIWWIKIFPLALIWPLIGAFFAVHRGARWMRQVGADAKEYQKSDPTQPAPPVYPPMPEENT